MVIGEAEASDDIILLIDSIDNPDAPVLVLATTMSPSPPPSPLSLSSLVDDDDDEDYYADGQQQHLLKINVLRIKKHATFPSRGTLALSKKNLVFRKISGPLSPGVSVSSSSSVRNLTWKLDSIVIEKYRGKISGGIKIIPIERETLMVDDEETERERSEANQFIFTMVNDRAYKIINDAINEAKLEREMKKVRRETIETMENSSVSLRTSLCSAGDDYEDHAAMQRLPLLVRPLLFIFLIVYRIISYLYRVCTGRRLFGPKDLLDALHLLSTSTHDISCAALKLNLSEGRMRSIHKDIESIRKSITKIKQVHVRCQSTYMPTGSVADASTTSRAFLETTGVSIAKIQSIIAFVLYAIRRAVNMPFFRFDQMRLARHSPTVGSAVRDANEMVDAVIEFAWKGSRESVLSSKIDEEAERIRTLLFNIKLCSVTRE